MATALAAEAASPVTLVTLPDSPNGVLSGCAVTAATSALSVSIASGVVLIRRAAVTVAAQGVMLFPSDPVLSRWDFIAVNARGQAIAVTGQASTVPAFPALPVGLALLAAVYIEAGLATVVSGSILDKRVIGITSANSGTATVADGTSTIVVSHGLSATPTIVLTTPNGDPGGAWWVTTKTSTQFTINLAVARAGSALTVDWHAQVSAG